MKKEDTAHITWEKCQCNRQQKTVFLDLVLPQYFGTLDRNWSVTEILK